MNTEITDNHVKKVYRPLPWLQRHPVPITAFFRHSLVLTYALPPEVLEPLLPPGLSLDTYNGCAFVAIAMVQTESLRPCGFPRALGQKFFLTGYRIFARYTTRAGRTLRGLRILRSDADRPLMVSFGNCLTHYNYHLAAVNVQESPDALEIQVRTPDAEADLHVIADLAKRPDAPPKGSPFQDFHQARLFAGPLPFTFDYESETHSIVMIEGVRREWKPVPVRVEALQQTFFEHSVFRGTEPILANAFYVRNILYKWKRGVLERLSQG